MIVRTLSVRQPWAWAILHAGKVVETRTWSTAYRGPILLHAGGATSRRDEDAHRAWMVKHAGVQPNAIPETFDRGGIVGAARLVDIVPPGSAPHPWYTGAYGWVLADAVALPFAPVPGRLGLWPITLSDLPAATREAFDAWDFPF